MGGCWSKIVDACCCQESESKYHKSNSNDDNVTSEENVNINTIVRDTGTPKSTVKVYSDHDSLSSHLYDPEYFSNSTQVSLDTSNSIPDPIGSSNIYRIIPVSDKKKRILQNSIKNTRMIVDNIEEIENKYLKMCYNLKKQQKLNEYPDVQEIPLFHGTKWANVDSICKNNFNWRLLTKKTGNLYGEGVCFSGNAMYASHYSADEDEKVMLVANVLIGKKCQGTERMSVPTKGYDTSAKNPDDNIVIVKYEDNEFYPIYRIRFHLLPPSENVQGTTQNNS